MAIRKIAFLHQDTRTVVSGDVIEHEGKLWLVPGWYGGPTKGTWRPARIMCLHEMSISSAGRTQQTTRNKKLYFASFCNGRRSTISEGRQRLQFWQLGLRSVDCSGLTRK